MLCYSYNAVIIKVKGRSSFSIDRLFLTWPFQQTSCSYSKSNKGASMSGTVQVKTGSESDLQAAVATAGPVAVAVDGSPNYFRVSGAWLWWSRMGQAAKLYDVYSKTHSNNPHNISLNSQCVLLL